MFKIILFLNAISNQFYILIWFQMILFLIWFHFQILKWYFKINFLDKILYIKILNVVLFWIFNNTAFLVAVEKGNIEIVELLLSHKDVDVSIKSISKKVVIFYKIPIQFFLNAISNF